MAANTLSRNRIKAIIQRFPRSDHRIVAIITCVCAVGNYRPDPLDGVISLFVGILRTRGRILVGSTINREIGITARFRMGAGRNVCPQAIAAGCVPTRVSCRYCSPSTCPSSLPESPDMNSPVYHKRPCITSICQPPGLWNITFFGNRPPYKTLY